MSFIPPDNRTILLTGMGGVLGEGFARGGLAASPEGERITVVGRQAPTAWQSNEFQHCDLTDETAWASLLAARQPAVVVYAAALARIDACEADPETAHALQVTAPLAAARWCAEHGGRMIYISTEQVFDGTQQAYSEADTPRPLHAYGRTKLAGEQAVLSEQGVVVRVPLLLGPRVSEIQAGADTVAVEAARDGRRLDFFEDEFRAAADPAHFVAALLRLIRNGATGLFHLAGAECISRWQLADQACQAAGIDNPHRPISLAEWRGDRRPPRLGLTCARAVRELGFAPPDLRQSLARWRAGH